MDKECIGEEERRRERERTIDGERQMGRESEKKELLVNVICKCIFMAIFQIVTDVSNKWSHICVNINVIKSIRRRKLNGTGNVFILFEHFQRMYTKRTHTRSCPHRKAIMWFNGYSVFEMMRSSHWPNLIRFISVVDIHWTQRAHIFMHTRACVHSQRICLPSSVDMAKR